MVDTIVFSTFVYSFLQKTLFSSTIPAQIYSSAAFVHTCIVYPFSNPKWIVKPCYRPPRRAIPNFLLERIPHLMPLSPRNQVVVVPASLLPMRQWNYMPKRLRPNRRWIDCKTLPVALVRIIMEYHAITASAIIERSSWNNDHGRSR